jgi:hypothetical protein
MASDNPYMSKNEDEGRVSKKMKGKGTRRNIMKAGE